MKWSLFQDWRTGTSFRSRKMNAHTVLVILILQCLAVFSRADISDQALQSLVDESTLIFTGTIVALSSNVGSIEASDNPMIVRVDHIEWRSQEASRNFKSLEGKQLTVIVNPSFNGGPQRKQGVSAVFFVDPLLYETNIAVSANAIADDNTVQNLSSRLDAAVQQKKQKPLIDAVKGADRIVIGVVQEIRKLPDAKLARLRSVANGRDLFSEHSPRWREAIVRVRSVLKGDSAEKMVIVIFPSTDDRMWAESPKFSAGEAGTWLLHGGTQLSNDRVKVLLMPEQFDGQKINAYTALRSEDFQSKDAAGKNEALIREILNPRPP